MHIAICDDNVADRKQLERLLKREEDVRKLESGVLYTDSYGTPEGLFSKRMSYDLFFIDLSDILDLTGPDLAKKLIASGVSAPVVLCSENTSYSDECTPDSGLYYLKKPVLKAELSKIMDMALEKEASKSPTIELRYQEKTIYVHEDDIKYARYEKALVNVYLKDNSVFNISESLRNLYGNLIPFSHYVAISKTTLINLDHMRSHSLFGVTMNDGTRFTGNMTGMKVLRRKIKRQKQQLN